MKNKVTLFWFRRDLRLEDNHGLSRALSAGHPVLPLFIFDKNILDSLDNKQDRRVDYFHQILLQLNEILHTHHSTLHTFHGTPLEVFTELDQEYAIQAVYCNRDYEPSAIQRDSTIFHYFTQKGIPFKAFKDQVIHDKNDIVKNDGKPYTVFTAYANKWKALTGAEHYRPYLPDYRNFHKQAPSKIYSLEEISFKKTEVELGAPTLDASIIDNYDKFRDYPALAHTSHLSTALRFGTISIRQCVSYAIQHNTTWLNELIWREFFKQILYHFPHVVHRSFKPQYDLIEWRNNQEEYELWCTGKTGYPIVDAGMRQLNKTGFMHNRVRMVTASFLCKHLLIDWRWGEVYFAQKLLDYDLSANNGNWQWASGSGCDAAPYFRIFNPYRQTERFDKDLVYIKRWIPEYGTDSYPPPIVDHSVARDRALRVYRQALKKEG